MFLRLLIRFFFRLSFIPVWTNIKFKAQRNILLHPLTLGESQLMRSINILIGRREFPMMLGYSWRKRLFEEKTMLPGNVIREEETLGNSEEGF